MPNANGIPVPNDILVLARTNPLVAQVVKMWERGLLTWEQSMMTAVVELAIHTDNLRGIIDSKPIPFTLAPILSLDPAILDRMNHLRKLLTSEVCKCGMTHSIEPADHKDNCRIRALLGSDG